MNGGENLHADYKPYVRNWDRYRYGVAAGDRTHLNLPVAKDPLKSGTKAEKLAFCQRQIDRYVRWKIAEPDAIEFTNALNQWTKMKKFVMEGRI